MSSILAAIVALALVFSTHPKHHVKAATSHLPSFPLAVRTPYLSTWLPGNYSTDVTTSQPEFWNGEALTWNVMARISAVNDTTHADTYTLFGFPKGVSGAKPAAQQGTVNHTSTHTTMRLTAGNATFVLDFFSPVSPKNYTRQSMPYSYLTVRSSASSALDIQIFSAIDGAWTGRANLAQGSLANDDGVNSFHIANPNAVLFTENAGEDQALWGTSVFATRNNQSDKLVSACGAASTLYSDFVKSGSISGSTCGQNNLYGHVHELADVTATMAVTFAVGLYQENAINFHGVAQTPYFRAQYPDIPSSISAFFNDYADAVGESHSFDQAIITAADPFSTNYTEILEASVRQAFAAIEITIPHDSRSTDPDGVNGFLKEISSDGNVNSIDVIYPTFPIFYVLAPEYIKLVLQPILSYLATPSGVWSLPVIPHDLGDHYPNATGHDNNQLESFNGREESMPIESTGQVLHMLLSYVNATGDYDFIKRYMGANGKYLLTTYADYLVHNGSYPSAQLTTVDALPEVANTTQLAITAALGVSAMGAMANMTNYTMAGAQMTDRIINDKSLGAINPNGTAFTYSYSQPNSFSVEFPLFVDKLWNLPAANSFNRTFEMQSNFYGSLLNEYPWGVPYSNQATWAITDWNMWSAAISSPDVAKRIIDSTYRFLTQGNMNIPFGTKYTVEGSGAGTWVGNKARSTVGSNFALLAVKGANLKW